MASDISNTNKDNLKCSEDSNALLSDGKNEEASALSLEVKVGKKCSSDLYATDINGCNSFSTDCSHNNCVENNDCQETKISLNGFACNVTHELVEVSSDSVDENGLNNKLDVGQGEFHLTNGEIANENKQFNLVNNKCVKKNADVFRKKEDKNFKTSSEEKVDCCSGTSSSSEDDKLVAFMKELVLNTKPEVLTSLSLVGLGLKVIDYDFSSFVNVINVDISSNKLSSLPNSFISFKQCTRLNISKNEFTEIPGILYRDFYFLQDLDVSFNRIKEFNLAPLCISYLVNLNASHNKLVSPPVWIIHDIPSSLKSLDISFNCCFKDKLYPFFFQNCDLNSISAKLTELDLSCTGFNSTNMNFLKSFPCLKVLLMGSNSIDVKNHNSIGEFPECILERMPLEVLNVESSNLTCLPDHMDALSHLKVLQVSCNHISWFPEKIVQLDCLSILFASKCQLVYLPKEMGCLTSLTELWISYNDISSLPDLKNCKRLKVLDIYCNSFSQLPDTVSDLKLEAFDACCNYFSPATYKQPLDNVTYEVLKTRLRKKLTPSDSRSDSIKVDCSSRRSSYSGSYCSSPKSWGSYKSSKSRRSTPSPSSFARSFSGDSKEDESWDVDPDDAWDPELYNDNIRKWTSDDSLSRCRFFASMTKKENYFCPHQERSSFFQNLYFGYTTPEVPGQFDDAM